MKLSLIQLKVAPSPEENLTKIKAMLKKAKAEGADLCVLPEMCCCPYENEAFVRYAMAIDDPFLTELAETAKELDIYLVAGSVPEKDQKNIYNTSFVYSPKGSCLARHRKVHLFDIDVEGGQYFMESDTFTAGNEVTSFQTPWGKFGVMICYDIRFPEMARLTAQNLDPYSKLNAILVPAAFNMTTGPAHWELSFRMRALDQQIFMAGCAPARNVNSSYQAWGHSIVTDPWGSIVAQLDEKEGILTVELDFDKVEKVREQLPLWKHRRTDLYCVTSRVGIPSEQLSHLTLQHKDTAKKLITNILRRETE